MNAPAPAALARRLAALLAEREEAREALRIADARFTAPVPSAIPLRFRGPFGSIVLELDDDYLREQLPRYSPNSPKGRRLRRLLRAHDKAKACFEADCAASGYAAAQAALKSLEADLGAACADALARPPARCVRRRPAGGRAHRRPAGERRLWRFLPRRARRNRGAARDRRGGRMMAKPDPIFARITRHREADDLYAEHSRRLDEAEGRGDDTAALAAEQALQRAESVEGRAMRTLLSAPPPLTRPGLRAMVEYLAERRVSERLMLPAEYADLFAMLARSPALRDGHSEPARAPQ
jgi:hypothetical protein